MNNFKSAAKLFLKLSFINRTSTVYYISFLAFGIALFAISSFCGECQGNEDYFISVAAVTMGICMTTMSSSIIFAPQNTRFFYSCPDAECIVTKIRPLWQIVTSLISTLITFVMTAISLNLGLVDGNRLSDLLLCFTYSSVLAQLSSGFFGSASIVIITWFTALPFYFTIFTFDNLGNLPLLKEIYYNGFGLPLHVSAIIFIGAMVVSSVISLITAKKAYTKRTTKTMTNQLSAGGRV